MIRFDISALPEHLQRRIHPDPQNNCWICKCDPKNLYPRIFWNGRRYQVHRFVYQCLIGPIPEGKQMHHVCKNKHCCNPGHLEILTLREHLLKTPSTFKRLSLCKKGHEFSQENTRIGPDGRRRCRICLNKANRRWRIVNPEKRREIDRKYNLKRRHLIL